MNLRLFAILGLIAMTTAYVTMEYEIINITQKLGGKYQMEARFIFEVKSKINVAEMEMLVNLEKNVTSFNARGTLLLNEADDQTWHIVTKMRSLKCGTFALTFLDTHQGAQPNGFCQTNLPVPPTTAASELIHTNRVPIVHVDSWPTGDGVHYRMNGKCDFILQSEIPPNSLKINITFNKPTIHYQHRMAELASAATDGSWYYVYTKYSSYFPVMRHTFQVTYVGQTPPIGYCYISLPGLPLTLPSSSTSQPSTSLSTEEPHPRTSTELNSTSSALTSTHTPASTRTHRVPVVFVDSWPTGDGIHYRMNGRCDSNLQSEIPPNSLNINITFNKPTLDYQHWMAEITSAAADGRWYYVYNKYNSYPPVMSHIFQLTYAGQTPPIGYCYTSLLGSPLTAPTSSTTQPSTSSSTEEPHPRTYTEFNSFSSALTSTQTPTANCMTGVQAIHVDIWPTGDGVHYRMNGRCDCNLQSEIPPNSLYINITFNKPTINYQDWMAAIASAAADGSWYYVYNKYNIYPPLMSYTFQVTYPGQTPPIGYCYTSLQGVTPTSPTSLMSQPSASSAAKELHSSLFNVPNSIIDYLMDQSR